MNNALLINHAFAIQINFFEENIPVHVETITQKYVLFFVLSFGVPVGCSISSYLSELLRYTNGPRLLRSSSQNFLVVLRTRLKTYGDRAFSAAAARLWNQLPPELRSAISVDQFRTQLKTYLFKLAYDV